MLPRRESSTLAPTTLDIPSRGGALRASCPLSNVICLSCTALSAVTQWQFAAQLSPFDPSNLLAVRPLLP